MTRFELGLAALLGSLLLAAGEARAPVHTPYGEARLVVSAMREALPSGLAGVPEEEQAKIAGANTARLYGFDVARLGAPTFA